MAYNIVSSAEFKPMSYSDIVAPLIQYKDEYQRVEDIYSQLLEKTLPWKAELEGYTGSDAYNTYNNFYNELNAAMEDFSKGMTTENAKGLLGLKRKHLSEIYPIERAVKKIDDWEKFKADIKRSNPYAEFTQDNISIDDVIKGVKPSKDYWDGNASMQRVTAKAGALAKSLYSNPTKDKLWLDGQYFSIKSLNGMPVEEFMKVLYHPNNLDTEASKMMRKIIDDELSLISKEDFSDRAYNRILNTINTAMYAGLANPKYENVANRDHITPMDMMNYRLNERSQNFTENQWNYNKEKAQEEEDKINGVIPFYTKDQGNGNKIQYFNNPVTGKVDIYEVNADDKKNYVGVSSETPYYGAKKSKKDSKEFTDKNIQKAYDDDVAGFIKAKSSVTGDGDRVVISEGGNTITYYFNEDGKPQSKKHSMTGRKKIAFEDLPKKVKEALKNYPASSVKEVWEDWDFTNSNDYKVVFSLDQIETSYGSTSSTSNNKSTTSAEIP